MCSAPRRRIGWHGQPAASGTIWPAGGPDSSIHRAFCCIALVMIVGCASSQHTPAGARSAPSSAANTVGQDAKVEPASTPGASSVPAQKFDGCDTCHIDSADEIVTSRHYANGIRCIKCHGPSIAHVRDENNEVKPDRVFTRKNTDTLCSVCHKCSRPGAPRAPATPGPDHKTCTDCHGAHKTVRQAKSGRS